MESESIKMTRCPRCGGLMVVGGACRACPSGAQVGDDSAGAAAVPVAYGTAATAMYGVAAPVAYGGDVSYGAPAPTPYGAQYGASTTASVGSRRTGVPVLVVVALVVALVAAAAGFVALRGGEEPAPAIPGWQLFEGGGISIQLPASYAGGNPAADPETVAEQLRAMGGDYKAMAEWVQMNKDAVLLVAADSRSASAGIVSNVNVIAEEVPSSITMEEYLEAGVSQIPAMFEVRENGVVTIGTQTVGRLVSAFPTPDGSTGMQLAYAFKDGDTMHVVTFTTSAQEWEARLPVFEQSAATFRH